MGLLFFADDTTPPPQDSSRRSPLWILIGGSLVILLIGVLWMLRKNREAERASTGPLLEPRPVKPPVPAAITAPPVAEPEPPIFPAAETETKPPPASVPPPKPDNLKKIKGIGPKISQVLNEEGIYTFDQLAEADVAYLYQLMVEREWQIASPETWPEQARQLADEKRKKQQGRS